MPNPNAETVVEDATLSRLGELGGSETGKSMVMRA
jgi:hypothetical protein